MEHTRNVRTLRDLKEYIQDHYPNSRVAQKKFNALARKLRGNANVSSYLRGGSSSSVQNYPWMAKFKNLSRYDKWKHIVTSLNKYLIDKRYFDPYWIYQRINIALGEINKDYKIGNAYTPIYATHSPKRKYFVGMVKIPDKTNNIYNTKKDTFKFLVYNPTTKVFSYFDPTNSAHKHSEFVYDSTTQNKAGPLPKMPKMSDSLVSSSADVSKCKQMGTLLAKANKIKFGEKSYVVVKNDVLGYPEMTEVEMADNIVVKKKTGSSTKK